MPEQQLDPAKIGAFMGQVMGNASGGVMTLLSALGQRLGLWKALAGGPATSAELAARAGVHPRYALEFLRAARAAGYVEHDPAGDRYALPPEHAAVLAAEGGPLDVSGILAWLAPAATLVGPLERAFKDGAGISMEVIPEALWASMEQMGNGLYDTQLVGWIDAVPGLRERLESGATVADVGCGAGRALLRLAREFPKSRFVGLELVAAQVERARANVAAAGLVDRIEIVRADAARGLGGRFDLVTTFDVLHDAPDPQALARAIQRALAPDGVFLCLEMNGHDHHEENVGPMAAALYGVSIFFCMSTCLAQGGPGLGAFGMPQARLAELCAAAGLGAPARIAEDPMSAIYAIRAVAS